MSKRTSDQILHDAAQLHLPLVSDKELVRLYMLTDEVVRYRTKLLGLTASVDVHGPGAGIHGQEMGKRALEVAVCGDHTILFVGPHGVGKTMLRCLGVALGHHASFEALPCPCGNYGDGRQECRCTAAKIEQVQRSWPECDITLFLPSVPAREMLSELRGTTFQDMKARKEQCLERTKPTKLTEDATTFFKHAMSELGISARAADAARRVAATIACMDSDEWIGPSHIAEAVNYRRGAI